MSGTDYTLTATLGLYKPIANMAVGLWGDLWNSNADAIDSAVHFATGGGPFLPLAGGNVFGATTFTETSNNPFSVVNPSMAYLPGLAPPNQVFRQITGQLGNQTAEQQFCYIYPNSNRSHAGVITGVLTIPASGMPSGQVARTQSPIFGTVVNYEPGANVGGIAGTFNGIAAVPNGLAYGLNTQVIDTITPNDPTANLLQTNVRLQNEYDYFVHNASTSVRGSLMLLYSTVASANHSNLVAHAVGSLGGTSEIWGCGYQVANGGAYVGLQIGSTQATLVPGLSSQPIELVYTNGSSATNVFASLNAVPADDGTDGDILLTTSVGLLGLKLENQARLKSLSSTGADLTIAYVNGSNVLNVGEGIGRTIIKGSSGAVAEFFTTGTAFNDIVFTGVANGSAPTIAAHVATGGTDTNVGLNINALGTGIITLGSPTRINGNVGFNTAPIAKPSVAGAWAGNTAGKALSTALAALGLITDTTTA